MLERNKRELLIGVNQFDKPAELSGKEAWSQLILYLLFTRKGSYPSKPEMGIGLQDYEFRTTDATLEILPSDILEQSKVFLPDVPLEAVKVDTTNINGRVILLIILLFSEMESRNNSTVIAADVYQDIIDFEIQM